MVQINIVLQINRLHYIYRVVWEKKGRVGGDSYYGP